MSHDRLVELGGAVDLHIRDREVFIQATEKTPFTNEAGYYFIDHDHRLPFWVHDVPAEDIESFKILSKGAALTPEY